MLFQQSHVAAIMSSDTFVEKWVVVTEPIGLSRSPTLQLSGLRKAQESGNPSKRPDEVDKRPDRLRARSKATTAQFPILCC